MTALLAMIALVAIAALRSLGGSVGGQDVDTATEAMSEETTVRALTTVPLGPGEAFALFTEEIDAWWRHGPRFRVADGGREGRMVFEPGEGGRLLEVYGEGDADDAFELGRTVVWEPPGRLVFLMGGGCVLLYLGVSPQRISRRPSSGMPSKAHCTASPVPRATSCTAIRQSS